MFVFFSMKGLSGDFHDIYVVITLHESALSISWYYTVVEVILKIDATKSLSPFPLCLTDDPLVLSKTVRKAILTIPFSKYIQG